MKILLLHRFLCFVCLFTFGAFTVGCEHGEQGGDGFTYGDTSINEEDKDSAENSAITPFVGTWQLTSTADGHTWYVFFNSDKSWKICDNSDGSQQRVYGSFSVSEGTLNGNMTNPNVGTGAIKANVSGNTMSLDFIEHWHTPYKTIHYSGKRL